MNIVSDEEREPSADTATALLAGVSRKCCFLFYCLFLKLSDHLDQIGCDEEMNTDLILFNFPSMCIVGADVYDLTLTRLEKNILLKL